MKVKARNKIIIFFYIKISKIFFKIDFRFSIYKSVMSKAISKMNKKELIEKIKQLEQEKHEDKERFIGAGQIIKKLQEENDKKSITLTQTGHTDFINTEKIKELQKDKDEHIYMLKQASQMVVETVEFLNAVNLYPIFLKCMDDHNNRIDLKELKDAINSIKCPECEKGKCEICRFD